MMLRAANPLLSIQSMSMLLGDSRLTGTKGTTLGQLEPIIKTLAHQVTRVSLIPLKKTMMET